VTLSKNGIQKELLGKWFTGFKVILGATLDNATPPAPISVPTNSKGIALELVPVHSEFMRGILNYGKDAQAAYEAGLLDWIVCNNTILSMLTLTQLYKALRNMRTYDSISNLRQYRSTSSDSKLNHNIAGDVSQRY
jgi:hypothetical protein